MANDQTESESIYDLFTPPKGGGNFFGLDDGESARIRIQSEPYAYQDTFKQQDGTSKVSTRFAWLIYNFDLKAAQVLKQSGTFYSSLAALTKDPDFGKDPTKHDVRVTRTGTGTSTTYAINLTKTDNELTPDILEAVANLDIVKDSNESLIIPVAEYRANGNRFNATTTPSGDVIVRDLDDEKVNVD